MAGNPFRRPGAAAGAAAPAGREAAADLSVDTSDTVTKPRKVVKRVRIQSPVISPDEPQEDPFEARLNDQGHSGSPPPVGRESDVATELRKSFIDSVAKGSSNLNREAVGDVPPQSHGVGLGTETTARAAQHQLLYNLSQQQALNTPSQEQPLYSPAHQQTPSNSVQQQAPFNPFARTLASIEGGYGTTSQPATEAKSVEAPTNEQFGATVHAAGKSAMDVDSFTRMLLTGTPRRAAIPTIASTSPISVEGSSTEASSIARHSMFESLQAPHPESPRSSYESSRSDDGADTNENSSLVADARPKKAKPPPPAHHRGKLLSKKGPQTVSFADFDTTHPAESGQESFALPSPVLDQSAARGRSASDLNKPLPPPPVSNSPSPTPGKVETENTKTLLLHPSQVDDELQFQKIRPPPPPITRRSSTKKTDVTSGRTRSSSNLSKSSIPEDFTDSPTSLEPPSSQLTIKPPPPPARRAANSVSSVERDNAASHSIPEAPSQASTSKAPPPPPSRQTLRGAPTLARTPSTQSTSSIGHRRTSPSINQAPPPPPPRRSDKRSSFDGAHLGAGVRRSSNGSQRSSIELRRSSGTSTNDAQAPPMSSLQYVPEGESGQDTTIGGKSILADLSAFQAEIDALRAQIGK